METQIDGGDEDDGPRESRWTELETGREVGLRELSRIGEEIGLEEEAEAEWTARGGSDEEEDIWGRAENVGGGNNEDGDDDDEFKSGEELLQMMEEEARFRQAELETGDSFEENPFEGVAPDVLRDPHTFFKSRSLGMGKEEMVALYDKFATPPTSPKLNRLEEEFASLRAARGSSIAEEPPRTPTTNPNLVFDIQEFNQESNSIQEKVKFSPKDKRREIQLTPDSNSLHGRPAPLEFTPKRTQLVEKSLRMLQKKFPIDSSLGSIEEFESEDRISLKFSPHSYLKVELRSFPHVALERSFGVVNNGSQSCNLEFSIDRSGLNLDEMDLVVEPINCKLRPEEQCQFKLVVVSKEVHGKVSSTLTVKSGQAIVHTMELSIESREKSWFSMSDDCLSFGIQAKTIDQVVTIQNDLSHPVEVTQCLLNLEEHESDNMPAFQLQDSHRSFLLEPFEQTWVPITFTPPNDGEFVSILETRVRKFGKSRVDGLELLEVEEHCSLTPLVGFGGEMILEPREKLIIFDKQCVNGDYLQKHVKIFNRGSRSTLLNLSSTLGSVLSVVPRIATVRANESATFLLHCRQPKSMDLTILLGSAKLKLEPKDAIAHEVLYLFRNNRSHGSEKLLIWQKLHEMSKLWNGQHLLNATLDCIETKFKVKEISIPLDWRDEAKTINQDKSALKDSGRKKYHLDSQHGICFRQDSLQFGQNTAEKSIRLSNYTESTSPITFSIEGSHGVFRIRTRHKCTAIRSNQYVSLPVKFKPIERNMNYSANLFAKVNGVVVSSVLLLGQS